MSTLPQTLRSDKTKSRGLAWEAPEWSAEFCALERGERPKTHALDADGALLWWDAARWGTWVGLGQFEEVADACLARALDAERGSWIALENRAQRLGVLKRPDRRLGEAHPETAYAVLRDERARIRFALGPMSSNASCLLVAAWLLNREHDRDAPDFIALSHDTIQRARGPQPRALRDSGPWLADFAEVLAAEVEPPARGRYARISLGRLEGIRALRVGPRVDVVSGKPAGRRAKRPRARELGPDSGAVLAYLDRVPDAAYRPESEALARASAACRNESDRASLRLALEGRPRWAPSRSGLGARVYAPGWTNLPREVRRALLPGTELDLRAAHLAIFVRLASDAGQAAPLAANALASGDAWGEIASHSGRDRDEVKRALCAAINGRTRAGWVWASPEVRPLARALAPWLDEIEAGRLALRLSDEQLHDELTKRELRLIRPVYDVAARYPGVTVALHLHDGVTVTGEESAIAAFVPEAVAAVARSAAELGVRSTLVRK